MVGSVFSPTNVVPFMFPTPLDCGYQSIISGTQNLAIFKDSNAILRFYLPSPQTSINVAIVARASGATPTGPLVLTLYADNNDRVGTTALATASYLPTSVLTGAPNWLPFVTLTAASQLAIGYYWIEVTSPATLASPYYQIFFDLQGNNFWDSLANAHYNPGSTGLGGNSGASTIWIEDTSGNYLNIMPFGNAYSPNGSSMSFTPQTSFTMNQIAPILSDMHFILGTYTAYWELIDSVTGLILAEAPANQYKNSHGLQGLIPFQFPSPISLIAGHPYKLGLIDGTGSNRYFATAMRGSSVNPSIVAPGNVTAYWYAKLANIDFFSNPLYDFRDYTSVQGGGVAEPISNVSSVAVRFVPKFNETLTEVGIKLDKATYAAGNSIITSIYASQETGAGGSTGAAPTGTPLGSVTVDSGTIANNWLDVTGFSVSLTAGTPYWVVWSAPTATIAFPWQRNVSPFRNLLLIKAPNTVNPAQWWYPSDGPSDLTWKAVCNQETIGTPFDNITTITINSSSNIIAQPFTPIQSGIAAGAFVYFNNGSGIFQVKIYPDNGTGTGPNMTATPLTTGTFNMFLESFYGGDIIPFNTPIALNSGTKYWAVYSMVSGTAKVFIALYWMRPTDPNLPAGYEALYSTNGGTSWGQISSEPASSIFIIGAQTGTALQATTLKLSISQVL